LASRRPALSERTNRRIEGRPAHGGPALHASGAAEADRHFLAVDDHRHHAAALAVAQHPFELRRVLLDVYIRERLMPPFIILTGGQGVGSSVFAEDVDHTAIVSHASRRFTAETAETAKTKAIDVIDVMREACDSGRLVGRA
jgi:hypothetical protein